MIKSEKQMWVDGHKTTTRKNIKPPMVATPSQAVSVSITLLVGVRKA